MIMQAANEALLKLLQVPKAVPQHSLPQQQQQQGQARPGMTVPAQASNSTSSLLAPATGQAGTAQQLPLGALQVQQQQQQQQQPQQLLHQQHQLQLQQQAQAAQLWQLRQGLVNAAAALPSGVSFLQSPAASLGFKSGNASLGPLAAQISAASTASASQSTANQASAQVQSTPLSMTASLASLPRNLVIPGVPVSAPQVPQTSASTAQPPASS